MTNTPTPAPSGGTDCTCVMHEVPTQKSLASCPAHRHLTPPASAPGSGEIQRWRQHYKAPLRFGDSQEFGLKPDAAGPWVRYDDHFAALARARSEVVTSLMDQLGVMSAQDDPRTMSGNPTDWMAAGLDAIKQTARAEGEAKGRREAMADAVRYCEQGRDECHASARRIHGEGYSTIARVFDDKGDALDGMANRLRGLAALAEGGGE